MLKVKLCEEKYNYALKKLMLILKASQNSDG